MMNKKIRFTAFFVFLASFAHASNYDSVMQYKEYLLEITIALFSLQVFTVMLLVADFYFETKILFPLSLVFTFFSYLAALFGIGFVLNLMRGEYLSMQILFSFVILILPVFASILIYLKKNKKLLDY